MKLLEELRETQRKVVWQDVLKNTVFVRGEYVRYRKGTMPVLTADGAVVLTVRAKKRNKCGSAYLYRRNLS